MKCDELKEIMLVNQVSGERTPSGTYKKAEVDDAIAELKQKLQDQCISCPIKMQEDDVVAEFKEKLEDAGMRERRLRRALYKALANWAHFAVAFFSSFKTKDKWHKMEHKCLKKAEEYK